jgi:hypothetical protein
MPTLSRALASFLTVSSFFALTACDIIGEKRTVEGDDSVLAAYFFSDQYASDNVSVRDFFSFSYGAVIAAAPTSNMDLWISPPSGCYYTVSFQNAAGGNVGIRRFLDVGTMDVLDSAKRSFEVKKDENGNYFVLQALLPGNYKFKSAGVKNGALAFEQDFTVPEKGGGLKVYAFLNPADTSQVTEQVLTSPALPLTTDPSYKVVFNRMAMNVVSFQAPTGTEYVRLRLRDGSNTAEGDVTCFAKPDEPLRIDNGVLHTFRTGVQGHMELDFVQSSQLSNVPKLKWSTIISSMRHFQGTFEYKDKDGIKHTENVGLVEFR